MDRLTTRSSLCDGCPKEDWCHQDCFESQLYERLAHYEDLEEAGRLVELPCKVGDTVWIIIDNRDYTRRMKGYFRSEELSPALCIKETKFDLLCLTCMGETIFLTKEEAEAKLADLKGE